VSTPARERRRFADGQFARIILLELHRRAHAVIAQAYGKGRCLLAHLERAMTALDHVLGLCIEPFIRNVVHGRGDEVAVHVGGRHGGQACEHGAHGAVVLHRRHIVIDLVGDCVDHWMSSARIH